MRKVMLVAIALAVGCATSGQEQKSPAISAQEQAHKQLQAAADAQKRAADEQARAEQAQRDVEQAQKALADAQARLRGQRVKAQQSQQEAQRLNEQAQAEARQEQQQAMQLQEQQAQKNTQLNATRSQQWTRQQDVQGRVVQASGDQLQVRTQDQRLLNLDVTDATAIDVDGRSGKVSQIQPGSDVRASYQTIDGKATALRIEVTSAGQQGRTEGETQMRRQDQGQQQEQVQPQEQPQPQPSQGTQPPEK